MRKKRSTLLLAVALLILSATACFAGEGWQANIMVRSGSAASRVTFGQDSGATDLKDGFYDVPALLAGSLRVAFTDGGAVLWQNIKALDDGREKEWLLAINSSLGEDIGVGWERADIPEDISVVLFDEASGRAVDMKLMSYYQLANNKSGELRIKASREMIKGK